MERQRGGRKARGGFFRLVFFKRGAASLFRVFFCALLCAFFFSCSRAEPSIDFGFLDLVFYQGENGPEERFSFFVIPRDDDGVENLDE
ncbi:MAG: hypothetical protein LBO76_07845, partial [Treponema sp.]|nr:hypothetical protein [Treponema sp.]